MTAARLPRASELAWPERLLYHGAVGGDYLLRTGLATVLSGAMLPSAALGGWRREQRNLEFYAGLAAGRDSGAVFAPPARARIQSTAGRGPGVPGGRVELLRFRSAYVAVNPDVRRDYARHENNSTARAQHWRHEDGPRPTLCVIHGFGASPAAFNTAFFSLKALFGDGWDVLLYTLPFHGSRRGRHALVNGVELFAHGMSNFSEGIIHAVHDFRALLDHLEAQGVPRFGVTGLSLGGYLSALLAAAEPRLDFAVPNAAVTWLPPLMREWFPANATAAALRAVTRVPEDVLEQALALHSPLNYPAALDKDRLMIVAGLADRLAPPSQSTMLWEHWGRPRLEWFPGSHILHFGRGEYQTALRELMDPKPQPATTEATPDGR